MNEKHKNMSRRQAIKYLAAAAIAVIVAFGGAKLNAGETPQQKITNNKNHKKTNIMGKTTIIYGSTTGATEGVAKRIAALMNIDNADIYEVSKITPEIVAKYDVLLLGCSTWGAGELQDDWYDGVKTLKNCDLKGKRIALFGTGDSSSFSGTFCGALGEIYKELKSSGATFIGQVSTDGYSFDESESVIDGKFIGLPIDEENESNKTNERIKNWVESLK